MPSTPAALVLAVPGSASPTDAALVGRLCDTVESLGGIRPVVGRLDHEGHGQHGRHDGYEHRGEHVDHPVRRVHGARPVRREAGLADALDGLAAEGHRRAVVVPLLAGPRMGPQVLGAEGIGPHHGPRSLGGGCCRIVGLPRSLAAPRPLDTTLTEGLGGEPDLAFALYGRLREAECRAGARADAVVLAAAGSARRGGDAGARTAVRQLGTLLHADRRPIPVLPASCSPAGRSVAEAVARLRAAGHRRIALAGHHLTPGHCTPTLAQAGAWTVAEPTADHPRIARLVLRRYAAHARPDHTSGGHAQSDHAAWVAAAA